MDGHSKCDVVRVLSGDGQSFSNSDLAVGFVYGGRSEHNDSAGWALVRGTGISQRKGMRG